jgi:hypothetical protein
MEVAKLSKRSRAGALVDDWADMTAANVLKHFRFDCEVVLCPAAFAASRLSMFNPGIDPSLCPTRRALIRLMTWSPGPDVSVCAATEA